MKITLQTKKLIKVLGTISINAMKKNIVPIHSYVYLEVVDNKFIGTTTNEESQVSQFFTIDEPVEFQACIDCLAFSTLVKSLAKIEEVSLTIKERKNGSRYMFIKYGRGSSKIDCINPKEFIKMDYGEPKDSITIVGDEFFEKVKTASMCVDSKDIRPEFAAISVKAENGRGLVTGFRAACGTRQEFEVSDGDMSEIFIPKTVCALLDSSIMSGDTEISITDKRMRVRNGSFEMTSILSVAKPLNLDRIYQSRAEEEYILDREMLLESCSRLHAFTETAENLIILSFAGAELIIEVDDVDRGRSGEETVPVTSATGGELVIGINARFLVDALRTIDSKHVKMNAVRPDMPLFLSEDSGVKQDWCFGPVLTNKTSL